MLRKEEMFRFAITDRT